MCGLRIHVLSLPRPLAPQEATLGRASGLVPCLKRFISQTDPGGGGRVSREGEGEEPPPKKTNSSSRGKDIKTKTKQRPQSLREGLKN